MRIVTTHKIEATEAGYTAKIEAMYGFVADLERMIEYEVRENGKVSEETSGAYKFVCAHMPTRNIPLDELVAQIKEEL